VRVGKDSEAFGSLAERFEAGEFEFGGRHGWFVLGGSRLRWGGGILCAPAGYFNISEYR
jgi:hypothetical protein